MIQQPDNFFREKLQNYSKSAPDSAWNRIESSLEKRKKGVAWWKVAASLSLLVAVAYLLWPKNSGQQPLAQSTSKHQPILPGPGTSDIKSEQDKMEQNPNRADSSPKETTSDKTSQKRKSKKIIREQPANPATLSEEVKKNIDLIKNSPVESVVIQKDDTVESVDQVKSITLKFTAEETDRYLNKKIIAQATSEEKKSSTFKKILRKANDLKSNQDPFGDLREKKNEILALNFKNEKRGQNK